MKTKRKNQVIVPTLSMLMFVLFLVCSAFAEKALPTSVPENAIAEMVEGDQATSNIDSPDNNKETNKAKSVRGSCENQNDDSASSLIAMLIPYEIFNGDYGGMVAKYFNQATC